MKLPSPWSSGKSEPMMCRLGARHRLEPDADKILIKWRTIEGWPYYPPSFELCTIGFGDFSVIKKGSKKKVNFQKLIVVTVLSNTKCTYKR